MNEKYDSIILEHYKKVAQSDGGSPTSTMSNLYVRNRETEMIRTFLEYCISTKPQLSVGEIGSGNGYTLDLMSNLFPSLAFTGYEYTPELKEIAAERLKGRKNVQVFQADIRDTSTIKTKNLDVIICQRVLINLLDKKDQKIALQNIIDVTRSGGLLLFIECFTSGLDNLNKARAEFSIEPLPPAHHNLYLDDDYFQHPQLSIIDIEGIESNFLSSHYYISRVFHPLVLGNKPFERNSPFVTFFTETVGDKLSGDFSPIKVVTLKKA